MMPPGPGGLVFRIGRPILRDVTGRATAAPAVCTGIIARAAIALSCAALVCLAGGCFGREKPDIDSNDAALKIPAIKSSVRERRKTIHVATRLVKDLDSDDAAVRFYAIQGLERLTGETYGYRYYDDEIERKPALRQWQAWLARIRGETPALPTSAPSTAPTSSPVEPAGQ
jgi:hypothetical protein